MSSKMLDIFFLLWYNEYMKNRNEQNISDLKETEEQRKDRVRRSKNFSTKIIPDKRRKSRQEQKQIDKKEGMQDE